MNNYSKKDECTDNNYYDDSIYSKESCSVHELYINEYKPPIKEVIDSFVKIVIKYCKIINTCFGKKIMINGYKIIKIHYAVSDDCGTVLSTSFLVPFCEYIPIELDKPVEICSITSDVEYVESERCTNRCIFVFMLIFVCVKVKETKDCCDNRSFSGYGCEKTSDWHSSHKEGNEMESPFDDYSCKTISDWQYSDKNGDTIESSSSACGCETISDWHSSHRKRDDIELKNDSLKELLKHSTSSYYYYG